MEEKNLKFICRELEFSKSTELTDEVYEKTLNSMELLFCEFSRAEVLGEISKVWPLQKAIPFFTKLNPSVDCTKKIKTIATRYWRCYNGGVERVQAQLMNLWVKMGYRVILFTEESENELDFPYPSSVHRIIIPNANQDIVGCLCALQQACQEEQVDLFINHQWMYTSVLWECMLLRMINIPYVLYTHGHFAFSIGTGIESLLRPEIFKLCSLVLSLSETNARFYQLCGCNSYMVQNPVPDDLKNNIDVSPLDSKHILFVGRLSWEKHPMDVLKIFKIVHDEVQDVILDIVGGDDEYYFSQINDYIEKNNLMENIFLHGSLPQSEVLEFYKKSACAVFTSEAEGYPMVVLETKSYGLPLMMYELPYLTLVKDGKGIVSTKQGDVQMMAKNIIELLKNDEYRKKLGREARESFNEFKEYDLKTTWSNIINYCSNNRGIVEDSAFFSPDKVTYADKFMEPMLLDEIKKGYPQLKETREYKVGRLVLKFPRKIKHLLVAMKRIMLE